MSIHATKHQDIKNNTHQKALGDKKAVALQDNRPNIVAQGKTAQQSKPAIYLTDNRAIQKKANNTGLPNQLKSNMENLSGHSLDDVKVHYNSDKPAQLQALAYAKGTDIHLAPGQEKHLPHETWHVVQQKQGRVKPTLQMKGKVPVNDDAGLEKEADIMGTKALQLKVASYTHEQLQQTTIHSQTVQRAVGFEYELDGSDVTSKYSAGKKKVLGLFGGEEPQPLVTLKKGFVIADYNTFDVSADSTPDGRFDVEVRIKHRVYKNAEDIKALQNTLLSVGAVLKKLQNAKKPVSGDQIHGDPNVEITGNFELGTLQATAGLSPNALYLFLSGGMGDYFEAAHDEDYDKKKKTEKDENPHHENEGLTAKAHFLKNYGKGSPLVINTALAGIDNAYPEIGDEEKKQAAAIITSFLTIPLTARTDILPYAKSATSLLARSDYATVFKFLPEPVLENKAKLKHTIMQILNICLAHMQTAEESHEKKANFNQAGADARIYPQGQIENSTGLSLTIGEWLDGLLPTPPHHENAAPKDLLTDANYPKEKYPHDDTEQLESLGGYGIGTDEEQNGTELPIFEFRKRMTISTEFLPHVVEGIWEIINSANGNM